MRIPPKHPFYQLPLKAIHRNVLFLFLPLNPSFFFFFFFFIVTGHDLVRYIATVKLSIPS
jgi:hypothetical protein